MGVRFQCPNGHKLHVKAELAGKRGICPECGARFVVPSFSGGRVPEDVSATPPPGAASSPAPVATARAAQQTQTATAKGHGGPPSSVVIKTQTPPPTSAPIAQPVDQPIAQPTERPVAQPVAQSLPPSPAAAEPDSAPSAAPAIDPIAWYVRPASGGQFGPATTEVFQQWIADGRVAVDSWVWRTGWADWKAGSEALALLADRPPLDPAAAMAAALDDRVGVMPTVASGGSAAAVETTTAEQRRLEIKRRKQRMRMISGLLALVALAMLMALVFVLVR
jgi:hypothetical protein